MEVRGTRSLSGLACALALLGALLHATLLPWHAAIGSRAPSAAQRLAADLAILCPGGHDAAVAVAPQPRGGTLPGDCSDCPICKGLAAVQLAILSTAGSTLLAPTSSRLRIGRVRVAAPSGLAFAPRNRGPPRRA